MGGGPPSQTHGMEQYRRMSKNCGVLSLSRFVVSISIVLVYVCGCRKGKSFSEGFLYIVRSFTALLWGEIPYYVYSL